MAHADSQCGVMKEMKGIGRIEIVLNHFHLAMEIGIIMLLNMLAGYISPDRLHQKCQQLLSSEAFKLADLKQATKLLKRWSM